MTKTRHNRSQHQEEPRTMSAPDITQSPAYKRGVRRAEMLHCRGFDATTNMRCANPDGECLDPNHVTYDEDPDPRLPDTYCIQCGPTHDQLAAIRTGELDSLYPTYNGEIINPAKAVGLPPCGHDRLTSVGVQN